MALITCPEPQCAKPVSSLAEACPHCGAPIRVAGNGPVAQSLSPRPTGYPVDQKERLIDAPSVRSEPPATIPLRVRLHVSRLVAMEPTGNDTVAVEVDGMLIGILKGTLGETSDPVSVALGRHIIKLTVNRKERGRGRTVLEHRMQLDIVKQIENVLVRARIDQYGGLEEFSISPERAGMVRSL